MAPQPGDGARLRGLGYPHAGHQVRHPPLQGRVPDRRVRVFHRRPPAAVPRWPRCFGPLLAPVLHLALWYAPAPPPRPPSRALYPAACSPSARARQAGSGAPRACRVQQARTTALQGAPRRADARADVQASSRRSSSRRLATTGTPRRSKRCFLCAPRGMAAMSVGRGGAVL